MGLEGGLGLGPDRNDWFCCDFVFQFPVNKSFVTSLGCGLGGGEMERLQWEWIGEVP